MLLKRFEAKTLPEALERVRTECGEDALLVETRQTHGGYLVVAARPETAIPTPAPAATRPAARSLLSKWTRGFQPLADKATDFGLSTTVLSRRREGAARHARRHEPSRRPGPAEPRGARAGGAGPHRAAAREPADPRFRTLAVVGPTGVGKTTTLAKLAARAKDRGERVAIVTLDTYRMAAVEQLRAFADLLAVPFDVAFTATDVRRLLQQHKNLDRVLIDTTGRSPRDREAMPLLEGNLRAGGAATVLCLSAGTRARDCRVVFDAYEPLGIDAVCLTKWDETVAPGEALGAVVEAGLPLSHLCIGQEVPADILAAEAHQLARAAFDLEPAGASA
jgi:flagellar biosynthesis GTPase FlhF